MFTQMAYYGPRRPRQQQNPAAVVRHRSHHGSRPPDGARSPPRDRVSRKPAGSRSRSSSASWAQAWAASSPPSPARWSRNWAKSAFFSAAAASSTPITTIPRIAPFRVAYELTGGNRKSDRKMARPGRSDHPRRFAARPQSAHRRRQARRNRAAENGREPLESVRRATHRLARIRPLHRGRVSGEQIVACGRAFSAGGEVILPSNGSTRKSSTKADHQMGLLKAEYKYKHCPIDLRHRNGRAGAFVAANRIECRSPCSQRNGRSGVSA